MSMNYEAVQYPSKIFVTNLQKIEINNNLLIKISNYLVRRL